VRVVSRNLKALAVDGIKELLLKLPFVTSVETRGNRVKIAERCPEVAACA